MNPKKFFAELKRRNVYKVAIAYAVSCVATDAGRQSDLVWDQIRSDPRFQELAAGKAP